MNSTPTLTPLCIYLFAALGVLISIILPILRALLPEPPKKGKQLFDETIKPYLVVGAFSLVSALLVVAGLNPKVTWQAALLAGYAWDSTLQKMGGSDKGKFK